MPSVDSEIALWSGTSGTVLKRATGTGIVKVASGVFSATATLTQGETHGSPDTDSATSALHHTLGTGANQSAAGNHTHSGMGDVTGQASSVDSELALFSGTGGKTIKRGAGTGAVYALSGVVGYGDAQFDVVETIPRMVVAAAATLTQNTAWFGKVRFARPRTITTMSWYNGATVAGNVDAGIYNSADGGATLTRLGSTGSTAAAGVNGVQSAALTGSVAVVPGADYWLALATDSATLTLGRLGVQSLLVFAFQVSMIKATSFPLPTPVTTFASSTTMVWVACS